jgi:hypothetical protein
MREIEQTATTDLPRSFMITALDAPGPGGASHDYVIAPDYVFGAGQPDDVEQANHDACVRVRFQRGPRNEPGSRLGVLDSHLIEVVKDRYVGFQAGPFASPEGAEVLRHLQAALDLMEARAQERGARGVLGKATP